MDDKTQRCFDGNGQQQPDLFPCSVDGSVPQCCAPYQHCASNGLCVNDPIAQKDALTDYVVDGCTDPEWENKGCVSECLDFGIGVDVCPSLGSGYFCCYGFNGCNCSSKSNPKVFKRENVQFVASLSADGSLPSSTTLAASTNTSASSGATSAPDSNPPARESDVDNNSLDVGLGVGLGLGVPLVLALLAVFWLWRRRQREARPNVMSSTDSPGYSDKPWRGQLAELGVEPAKPAELPFNYR